MLTQGRYSGLDRQWRKPMFSFFDYLPMRYHDATQRQWAVRRLVWSFKDGKAGREVSELTVRAVRKHFKVHPYEIVFLCVPASSQQKNEVRYKDFSESVCRQVGMLNGYEHVKVIGERQAVHLSAGRYIESTQRIELDTAFFKGRKVLLFDDILTLGYSYARFALRLEKAGAEVIGGFFLGKTIYKPF